jgi:hypothetical protein
VRLAPLPAQAAAVGVLAAALRSTAAQQEQVETALREARALIRTYQEEVRSVRGVGMLFVGLGLGGGLKPLDPPKPLNLPHHHRYPARHRLRS